MSLQRSSRVRRAARRLKRLLIALLYYSGITWLVFRAKYRRRAVVLMYHRVLPAEHMQQTFSAEAIVVTAETFERHMRFLRRHCSLVDADTFAAMLRGERPWLPRTCLVTFDDGWFDNAEHALPILARHRVPALIFLATGYVGTQGCFWQERLSYLLFLAWRAGAASRALFSQLGAPDLPEMHEQEARPAIRQIVTALKARPRAELEALIARVESELQAQVRPGESAALDRFMSWLQVDALRASGLVTLGSHAHSHTPLTMLAPAQVAAELSSARRELQQRLGVAPAYLAYPNGDCDAAVVEQARKAGHVLAFTTRTGTVRAGDDALALKRMNVFENGTESSAGFLCRILGWA